MRSDHIDSSTRKNRERLEFFLSNSSYIPRPYYHIPFLVILCESWHASVQDIKRLVKVSWHMCSATDRLLIVPSNGKMQMISCAVLLKVTHWITGGIPIQMSTWETLKIGKILKQKWRLKSGYVLSGVHWLGNNIWPKDNTEFLQFALGSWSRQGQESLPSQWFVFRKPWARLPR